MGVGWIKVKGESRKVKVENPYISSDMYLSMVEEAERPYALADRFFSFAVNVIRQIRTLAKSPEYNIIINQLIKASTSIGADYEEAQAAVSRADLPII